jgi:hypothetical protein
MAGRLPRVLVVTVLLFTLVVALVSTVGTLLALVALFVAPFCILLLFPSPAEPAFVVARRPIPRPPARAPPLF